MNETQDEEKQRTKNKRRLLLQNKKLNTEIRKLEGEMKDIMLFEKYDEDNMGKRQENSKYK